ncbi:spore coat protein [Bacillus sp. 165]|uniref:spore coat protein n=1 Tax=Bacillus sp. 165 TaxID=1529117 RepID=UPI001ADC3F32|nr:spore coat protein [Bacillus sp. 165]MBO9128627.1 spore coat protein [Bacillus sp. 165]
MGLRWQALNTNAEHPISAFFNDDATIEQQAAQNVVEGQFSREKIYISDSLDINVSTTETQVAVALQAALQIAIAIVINIAVLSSDAHAEDFTHDLLQNTKIVQSNRQNIIIKNSRSVTVSTVDTDVAVSIQLLLQVLLALLIQVDVLSAV